jgi:uncharacterized protein YggT (Ycf19 family)
MNFPFPPSPSPPPPPPLLFMAHSRSRTPFTLYTKWMDFSSLLRSLLPAMNGIRITVDVLAIILVVVAAAAAA